MSGNGHGSPAATRARLNHPVIDADGHWLEFRPVLAEQMRRVGGEAAVVDGLASVGSDTREALAMSVDERRRRGICTGGVLGLARAEHARSGHGSPAAAPLRAARRAGHRLRGPVPYDWLARAPHQRRRPAARHVPGIQRGHRRDFPGLRRSHDPRRGHPHAHARRGDRRAGVLHAPARLQGRDVRQPRPRAGRRRRRRDGPRHRWLRPARPRQRARLRPAVGQVRRAARGADLPHRQSAGTGCGSPVELRLQPHRPLRRGRPRRVQGDVPGRSHPPIPEA